MILAFCMSLSVCASDDSNALPSLDEIINQNQEVQPEGSKTEEDIDIMVAPELGSDYIENLEDATDMSEQAEGIETITSGIKTVASYVIQILCYAVTVLLVLRVVLDLAYIGLPFLRSFLANGYMGNAQAGAGGMANSMAAGGMGGFGTMRGGMHGQSSVMDMNQPVTSNNINNRAKIQLVSNAALNAVASESMIGSDGNAVSPFKLYVKDMVVVLIMVPILLTLAVTGALTNLGFFLGGLLVDVITGIGNMI